MASSQPLDGYDRKILDALSEDGRLGWRDLADLIGLPLTPTLRRVRRLEGDGYIQGYTARVDEERVLGAMSALVRVTLELQGKDAPAAFEQMAAAMPEIVGGFLMTGVGDYVLHAVVRGPEHHEALLARLASTPGVADVQSTPARRAFSRPIAAAESGF